MKKILPHFLISLAVTFALAACSDDDSTRTISLSTYEEAVNGDGAVINIDVSTSVDWSAYSSADWIEISPAEGSGSGTAAVRVVPNFTVEERISVIAFTDGFHTSTVKIVQSAGNGYGITADQDYLVFEHEYTNEQIAKGEHMQIIELTTGASDWIATHDDWIRIEKQGNRAIITVDEYYGPTVDREGKIIFGGDNFEPKAEVTVYQTQFLVMEDAQGFYYGDDKETGLGKFVVAGQAWTKAYYTMELCFYLDLAAGLDDLKFEPGRYPVSAAPQKGFLLQGYEGEELGYPAPKGTYLSGPNQDGMLTSWLMTDGYVDVKLNSDGEYYIIAVLKGYNWETNEDTTRYIRIPFISEFENRVPVDKEINDITDVVLLYGGIPSDQGINNLKTWAVYICHGDTHANGRNIEYVTGGAFAFFVFMGLDNDGVNIDEGTYNIEFGWPWQPFTFFNSWYTDAGESASDPNQTYYLNDGHITISRDGAIHTLDFDVVDERGYRLYGTYTGTITYYDNTL